MWLYLHSPNLQSTEGSSSHPKVVLDNQERIVHHQDMPNVSNINVAKSIFVDGKNPNLNYS